MDRALALVSGAIERALAFAFIGAVCLNFANVVGRYGFGYSFAAADELQIYTMVCMAFLGAAVVTWRGQHLRMDVLLSFLPPSARRWLQRIELLIILVLASFASVQSGRYTWQMFVLERKSDNAGIPMWIPHGAVALGFVLISLMVLLRLVQRLRLRSAG